MRNRAPLVLMEQVLMVLVFALAAAVSLQAFVLSDRLSEENAARDRALNVAQSMAETWKSCRGDLPAAAEAYGGKTVSGRWETFWDGDWNLLPGPEGAVYTVTLTGEDAPAPLRRASVAAYDAAGKSLCVLPAAVQEAME